MSQAPQDEIKVRGRKPKGGPGAIPGGGGIPGPAPPPGPGLLFLPPAVVNPAIEEIVVTAQRQTAVRTFAASAFRLLGWPAAVLSGIYSLDQYRQTLEAEQDEKSKREAEIRRLNRLRQEQPLPEIVVRAPAPAAQPLPQLVPARISPLITPDFDPAIMVPFEPVPLPMPKADPVMPGVEIAPITAPTIPSVQPAIAPSPAVLPQFLPFTTPIEMPLPGALPQTAPRIRPSRRTETAPAPQISPATSPAVSPQVQPFAAVSPATQTRIRTRSLTEPRAQSLSLAEIQLNQSSEQKKCKPCKEDKTPRDKCYRKLVKEGLFPDMDTTYEWAEIDCITQREL